MSYQSAHDLPSFQELSQQLTGLKATRFLIPKAARPDVKALERQLRFMGDTVDRFYAILGPRNWIFHEHLSLDDIARLLDESADADQAERKLIDYYLDPDNLSFLIPRVNRFAALRKRLPLIQRAKDDYLAGRYYATVHVLLAVMDGFVNEFETVRRGLHAREAEELNAWDSVVGHHLGLTNAHGTFRKSKGATSEDPVYELYRNGIVHGTLLNYNNDVVATKAWNRLFAVMDWAKAREREQEPAKPKPTWREVFAQLAETSKRKRANEAWSPETADAGSDGFASRPVVVACDQYLGYWQRRNYGAMAKLTSHLIRSGYGSKLPGVIRKEYAEHTLTSYEILSIDHLAPAICHVIAKLVLNSGTVRHVKLRWIFENESGDSVAPPLPGAWGLIVWGPAAFLSETVE